MTAAEFSQMASGIPADPGVYMYFNADKQIIYVGKAKNLRKRIGSYFSKSVTNRKTIELVKRIASLEFTIVNNEHDALLLENSLIKEHQPYFNINLKDDKTYPYIVIKKEPFPRVFFTRRKIKDGSHYFGPYTSVAWAREIMDMIRETIPLRTCTLNLSEKNIRSGKYKVCLEYHLGKCKGPCEGLQSTDDYEESLRRIKALLKGKLHPVIQELKREIAELSEKMEFEKAMLVQNRIDTLRHFQSKSLVVDTQTGTVDVFSILEEGDTAYVNYLAIEDGSIVHAKTITLEKKLEESKEEILLFAIVQLREQFSSEARELIVPFDVDYPDKNILITVPTNGDKKKLLELSEKNVSHYKHELHARKILKLEGKTEAERNIVLGNLQKDLSLKTIPLHIECFDNSNFQGSHPVGAMVCFKNGEPNKKEYRHFNITSVIGINDFASMEEIVLRRYQRLVKEGNNLPDLVIIDGGKGQLNAAMNSIKNLGLQGKIALVGLAKNQEELFFPGDSASIKLDWNSESLKLIRRIRDEVHRYGIGFHRNKRSKAAIKNEIEDIPGIGKQTAQVLLRHFKTMKKIREASEADIGALIGISKAKILNAALHKS